MSRGRGLAAVLLPVLVLCLVLGGCGRKGNLEPPEDEPETWPRVYPTR